MTNKSNDRIRLGLIGCGHQGRNLCTAIKDVEKAKLVAIADIDEGVAKGFMKDFSELGIETYYLDHRYLLSREDIDAVLVVTPHNLLKELTIHSIKAGKHVFLEKPMGLNRLEAREIIDATKMGGVKLMVGYSMRYVGVRELMKDLIKKGAIGKPNLVNAGKACATLSGWLADPIKGGGVLLYIGVHLIDQVLWMIENEAERIFAEVNIHPDQKMDETEVFTIRFENGVLANLNCSMQPWYRVSAIGYDFVEVLGSEGYIRSDWPRNTLSICTQKLVEYKNPTTIQIVEDLHLMFRRELEEFVESILDDRNPAITGEDGLRVLEITDAVLESKEKGEPVKARAS